MEKAGLQLNCPHTPITDADKWQNPQDCWCEQCGMMCCRSCFKLDHQQQNHKVHKSDFTKEDWQAHVLAIPGAKNNFVEGSLSVDAPTLADASVDELKAELTLREKQDQARFNNEDPEKV